MHAARWRRRGRQQQRRRLSVRQRDDGHRPSAAGHGRASSGRWPVGSAARSRDRLLAPVARRGPGAALDSRPSQRNCTSPPRSAGRTRRTRLSAPIASVTRTEIRRRSPFFLARGYEVMTGLTSYSPARAGRPRTTRCSRPARTPPSPRFRERRTAAAWKPGRISTPSWATSDRWPRAGRSCRPTTSRLNGRGWSVPPPVGSIQLASASATRSTVAVAA